MFIKGLFSAVLCAGLFFSSAVRAEALAKPGCEPQLNVTTLPFEPREDFTRGFANVNSLTQKSGHDLTRAGPGVGATRVGIYANNNTTTDAAGCPALNVGVGYINPVIFIAKELLSNECAKNHVLEHEYHHVALYRESLVTLAERTKKALEPRLAAVFASPTPEVAIKDLLEAAMDEAATVMPLHHAFDSEDEYDRNSTACDGAIRTLYQRWRRLNR